MGTACNANAVHVYSRSGRIPSGTVASRMQYPVLGPLGAYTDGYGVQRECSTRLEPLGAYTVGYRCIANAVSRFRAARGVYRRYGCIANAVSRFRAARGVCRWVRCNANAVSRLEPLGAYTELITPAVRAARGGIRYTREI